VVLGWTTKEDQTSLPLFLTRLIRAELIVAAEEFIVVVVFSLDAGGVHTSAPIRLSTVARLCLAFSLIIEGHHVILDDVLTFFGIWEGHGMGPGGGDFKLAMFDAVV